MLFAEKYKINFKIIFLFVFGGIFAMILIILMWCISMQMYVTSEIRIIET